MTNSKIIFTQQLKLMNEGIIGTTGRMITMIDDEGNKSQVPEPEEIHTFADWKQRGFIVNKGEKAKARFQIWNYTSKASKRVIEARKAAGSNDEEAPDPHYYMKEAYFFTRAQVSAIA